MRLQAGGSLLSPEKYAATPQIRKEAKEQGHITAQIFLRPQGPSCLVVFSVYSPPTLTALHIAHPHSNQDFSAPPPS